MHFANFFRNSLQIFENSPASGGSDPRTFYEAETSIVFLPNRNPGGVAGKYVKSVSIILEKLWTMQY